jgi:hypothetical protein
MSRSNVEMKFIEIWESGETDSPDFKKERLSPCFLFGLGA